MWYRHALHQPSDFVVHQPLGFAPHNSYFQEQIALTIDVVSVTW
jgi:hypothetical protein